MALRQPIAVYNAANNMEAHFLRDLLIGAGLEAFITEDLSQVGTWYGGLIPEIHKPQVWVERTDIERATPILEEYERRASDRRHAEAQAITVAPIEVVCEKCGGRTSFAPALKGSVEQCPHCGAFVDVEDDETLDEWSESSAEDEPPVT